MRVKLGLLAALAALILAQGVVYYRGLSIVARDRVEVLEQALQARREAEQVLARSLREAQEARTHWRLVAERALAIEGVDEELNPFERAILDSVREARNPGSDPGSAAGSGDCGMLSGGNLPGAGALCH